MNVSVRAREDWNVAEMHFEKLFIPRRCGWLNHVTILGPALSQQPHRHTPI
jgi:hypothetical protein